MSRKVFKTNDKSPLTETINIDNIPSTIKFLEKITNIDFSKEKDNNGIPIKWLGSTGRKTISNDIDLSVNENEVSKDTLKLKLIEWIKNSNIKTEHILNKKDKRDGYVSASGDNIHFRCPINGDPKNGYVQVDFMFTTNPTFQQESMVGGLENSPYKGSHRHILLASIARARGYKYSYKNGLMDAETNQTLIDGKDFNAISKKLLGQTATSKTLRTVESIIDYAKKLPNYEELVSQARETLKEDGVTLPLSNTIENFVPGSSAWFRDIMNKLP